MKTNVISTRWAHERNHHMINNNTTTRNSDQKDGKQVNISMKKIRDALNERLPSIEDTAPDMRPKSGGDEFEGPCPFCGGKDRFVVFPGEKNRYICRNCSPDQSHDKIDFHQKYRNFNSFMLFAKNVVPHVFASVRDDAPQEPSRKKETRAIKDFTLEFESIRHGDPQKSKIQAFLVNQRGFPDAAIDNLMKECELRYIKKNWEDKDGSLKFLDTLVVPYRAANGSRIPYMQDIAMGGTNLKNGGKLNRKGSTCKTDGFFAVGMSADTIMIHESAIDALAGKLLFPNVQHIALGSSTYADKAVALKDLNKTILVAQDNDPAGQTMLLKIYDILGSKINGIKWPERAKAKMDMNDILLSGNKPELGKMFVHVASVVDDGLIGGFLLSNKEFDHIKWAIKGLVVEGVNLLAGKPKCGKSILCLNLAISIATGRKAFDFIDVEKGEVIYLALEDVERRLKDRQNQMAEEVTTEFDNIKFSTDWPKMGEGGIAKLAIALEKRPNTRLVIIDTLKMFRPAVSTNKKFYDADYEPITRIKKEIADKFNVPVLIIHHLRKSDAEDIFDTMSGSTGLTGATDSNIIFQKGSDSSSATLHVQGRDIESAEYALKLDSGNMTWKFLGDAKDIKSTDNKQKLYDAIKEADKPMSPKELAKTTGIDDGYVRKTLSKLKDEGNIKKQGRGKYIYSADPEKSS